MQNAVSLFVLWEPGERRIAARSGDAGRGARGEGGLSFEKGRVGGMEGDRSTGPLDRRTERQETGDRSLRAAHARGMRRLWSLRYNKYRIGDRRASERGMRGVREERKGGEGKVEGWRREAGDSAGP
ncbi:hypothetical protein PUN28_001467 [Cardiocondyla obscurior]|uniref:Uncharacterized protein n=1 Tax=Cardiocondyla obscurior TaxID=286306 RepID=A0AAW2H557_9HYME